MPKNKSDTSTARFNLKSLASKFRKVPTVRQSGVLVAGSAIVLVAALAGYYNFYYSRPSVVFWSAIERSLNTPGVIRRKQKVVEEGSSDVLYLIRFAGSPAVQETTEIIQPSADGAEKQTFKNDTLSTPDGDFQRITQIPGAGATPAQKIVIEKVIDKWVQTAEATDASKPTNMYVDSLVSTVPFGMVPSAKRASLIDAARFAAEGAMPAIVPDIDSVVKTSVDGRKVYEYTVTYDSAAFVSWYQQYFESVGLAQFADEQFAPAIASALGFTSEQTKVKVGIDVLSRQIVTVEAIGEDNPVLGKETIVAYDVRPLLERPKDFLTQDQFQQIVTEANAQITETEDQK